MLALGGLLLFGAYAVGGYGYVLIRGWDIPFRGWVSPLHPYQWPAGGPSLIPKGQVFPSSASSTSARGG